MTNRISGPASQPWFQYLVRVGTGGVGLIFLLSGIKKILHPVLWRIALHDYSILPLPLEATFALVLPPLEVAVGIALFAGILPRVASYAGLALLAAFGTAMIIVLLQGRVVDCGCAVFSGQVTLWTVLRDILYALPLACVAARLYPPFRDKLTQGPASSDSSRRDCPG